MEQTSLPVTLYGCASSTSQSLSSAAPMPLVKLMAHSDSPATQYFAKQLTKEFIQTLYAKPSVFSAYPNRINMVALENAITLLEDHPSTMLLLDHTEVVTRPSDGQLVTHTVLTAIFEACSILEPSYEFAQSTVNYSHATTATKIANWFRTLFSPSLKSVNKDAKGRYTLQANIMRGIRQRLLAPQRKTQSEEEEQKKHDAIDEPKASMEDENEFSDEMRDVSAKSLEQASDRAKKDQPLPVPSILCMAAQTFLPAAPTISELIDEYGYDANEFNSKGLAPLHVLIQFEVTNEMRMGYAQRLLEPPGRANRADVNLHTRTDARTTALHLAMAQRGNDMIVYLLQQGADPSILNADGHNAFYCLASNIFFIHQRHTRLRGVIRYIHDFLLKSPDRDTPDWHLQRKYAGALFHVVEVSRESEEEARTATQLPRRTRDQMDISGYGSVFNVVPSAIAPTAATATTEATRSPSNSMSSSSSSSSSSCSSSSPPVPPTPVPIYKHVFELLDEKVDHLIKESADQLRIDPLTMAKAHVPPMWKGSFRAAVSRIFKPVVVKELDAFLIPDLANIAVEYLL